MLGSSFLFSVVTQQWKNGNILFPTDNTCSFFPLIVLLYKSMRNEQDEGPGVFSSKAAHKEMLSVRRVIAATQTIAGWLQEELA